MGVSVGDGVGNWVGVVVGSTVGSGVGLTVGRDDGATVGGDVGQTGMKHWQPQVQNADRASPMMEVCCWSK